MSIKKYINYLFFPSIFLVNLPPFYLFYKSLLSPRVAEIIWFLLFIIIFFTLVKKDGNVNKKIKILLCLSLIFFISQTMSIIHVIDLRSFIFRYEIAVFSYIFLLLTILVIKDKKQINSTVIVIIASFVIPIIIQLLIYFLPDESRRLIFPFLHPNAVNLIEYNLLRGRVYLENFNFAIIPLLFYFLFKQNKLIMKVIIMGIIALIVIVAYSSNFRTVFLLTVITIFASIFIFRKKIKQKILFILIICLLFFLGISISNKIFQYNVIDRILIQDVDEDYKPISGRIYMWSHAYEVGLSSPIFGVGLGNYFQYSTMNIRRSLSSTTNRYTKFFTTSAAEHPHNVFFGTFAESGILGLVSLIALLSYFIFSDIKSFSLKNDYLKCLIIGFWALFAYSLLNPATGIRYSILFWLYRVLIIKIKEYKAN